MTQEKYDKLEKKVDNLTKSNLELTDRCKLLGNQITTLKEQYNELLIEIRILKEGGNL